MRRMRVLRCSVLSFHVDRRLGCKISISIRSSFDIIYKTRITLRTLRPFTLFFNFSYCSIREARAGALFCLQFQIWGYNVSNKVIIRKRGTYYAIFCSNKCSKKQTVSCCYQSVFSVDSLHFCSC